MRFASLLLLLLGLAAGRAAGEGSRDPAVPGPVCSLLASTPVRDAKDALLLRRRIVALGPDAIAETLSLLELLCDAAAGPEQAFASPRAGALAAALWDHPPEHLRRALDAVAREATSRRARESALCLLAQRGTTRDLELALALAGAPPGAVPPSAASSERALAALLARERATSSIAARAFERCSPEAATALVAGAARAGGEDGLELLLYWLGRRPALDPWILARASSLRVETPVSAEARGNLRRALAREEPEVVALAARLAGRSGDDEAVGSLLLLLEHPDAGVRTGAHLGLCALAASERGPDPAAWRSWYERERQWWEREGARAIERLTFAPPTEAAELISSLSRRRLFRREAMLALVNVLRREDTELLRLACAALGQLRVSEARPLLEPLEEHRDPGVRAAAAAALASLGPTRAAAAH